jgi:hypothetical protein
MLRGLHENLHVSGPSLGRSVSGDAPRLPLGDSVGAWPESSSWGIANQWNVTPFIESMLARVV